MTDTIAAISTPRGTGGIAVIRISGTDAVDVADRVFVTRVKRLCETEHAHARVGNIVDSDGNTVDKCVATVFYAPHSYTGEDTVEISCHGGALVTEEVLTAVLHAGARLAEPGEFTRRAFTSGKLTLSEAESVGDLIHAATRAQLRATAGDAMSLLSRDVDAISGEIVSLLARINVKIDYPEEDLADIDRDEALDACRALSVRTKSLLSTYRTGRAVMDGVDAVICGRPNAGKSTLYNLFVGEDAAIVTPVAGTTRDTLTASVTAGRVLLRLSDTAGIRTPGDEIEAVGVERAKKSASKAELLITVHDSTVPLSSEDGEVMSLTAPVKIAVINKIDRDDAVYINEYTALARERDALPITTSLIRGRGDGGFDALVSAIEHAFTDGDIRLGHDAVVLHARQNEALASADSALERAVSALTGGMMWDIVTSDLNDALDALYTLSGKSVTDEVLGEIFGKFCVGK